MSDTQVYQTLLNQWSEQYQTLHDILNCEQLALEKRNFEELETLIKEKNELIKTINFQQLPNIIKQGQENLPQIAQVKQFCLSNSKLKAGWDKLMNLVEQCHFKNEVNARLIELLTSSTKRTFNLIKGFNPDNHLYNSAGDSTVVKHFGQSLSA